MENLLKLKYLYKLKVAGVEYFEGFSSNEKTFNMPNELKELENICKNCTLCDLSKTRTNIVFGEGNPKAKLMFIGEGPGEMEDKTGRPFVGRAGKLLTKIIENVLELSREDVYIANIVKCRPPNNRVPTIEEAESCKPYLIKQIDIINPKILVCLGKTAFMYLMNNNIPISKIRGQIFEYKGKKVIPTYHPSFLLRNPSAKKEAYKDFLLIKELL
ncbi:uracil-DNA glycosylase [Caminibacter mediatlanticus TB-2]|uniref:Type-4 uracil-DNA glycosylase n=1 Tax=Caminibacter mediatlanticus TB-2 TaxID=391592 RepID=A0AAI9AJ65_9BACT|nr:uracil-DNA glycosylase [Caminibacter mediatlanticus]EDM24510.1 Uracil-DNA glycosylase [Caminibacter mediatlanticus TB-2]QCT95155.1 uracil-DNA glycosylase [Caminibacter mediatlanticus TB-2]